MSTKINQVVIDNFNNNIINIQQVNIKRLQAGFVQSSCDYAKTMVSIIIGHIIQNLELLNDDRLDNVNDLINRLSYDR